MAERKASYDSHRPLFSKGVTLIKEPNVTHYATMTPENMSRYIMDIPVRVGGVKSRVLIDGVESEVLTGGVMVPVPTVEYGQKLPLEPVYYEVRDDVDYSITNYGNIPIGGIEQRSFRTFDTKNAYMHLIVPAHIGPDEQKILLKKIHSIPRQERKAEVRRITSMLPKVSFFEDKGLMFQLGGVPILTLTPNGPVINREVEADDSRLDYNFCELKQNQQLQLDEEDYFFFECVANKSNDPFIGSEHAAKTGYMIAGVSFLRSIDFDYINTYIKTYLENGGKLTDDLIRDELFHPYLEVLSKNPGVNNGYK